MKRNFAFVILFISSLYLFGQAPQSFKYQTVVRDGSGQVIVNQNVSLRISILSGSMSGPTVYQEEHSAITNDFGLLNIEIGGGNVLSGNFTTINWGNNSFFVQVELDETGGTTYQLMGTSQLLSVPYSLYANEAGNVVLSDTSASNELQVLSISNDTIYLTNGGYVELPAGFSGDYNDLTNTPDFTNWDTNVTDDFDGQYSSLSGTPVNVSSFTNDAGYITSPDDADADPTNELQVLSLSNDTIYLTNGNYVKLPAGFSGDYNDLTNTPDFTNWDTDVTDDFDGQYSSLSGTPANVSTFINDAGYITSPDDADADPTNELQVLNLSNDTIYLSNGNNIFLETLSDTSYWEKSGSELYYDLGNVGIGTTTPGRRLTVKANPSSGIDEAIFAVQNSDGDTVFAVYNEGVRIWVNDDNGTKATGSRGGFAVGGFSPAKAGFTNEYLRVTPDSVRVYIEENSGAKASGSRGGFAVGGFSPAKTPTDYYFNIEYDSSEVINPSEPRMLWYPNKEAFLTGKVLIEDVDSVGTNSIAAGYEPKALGDYSQAFGFYARAGGNNSIAIGNYANTNAANAFAFGDSAQAKGVGSFAIGSVSRDTAGNATNNPTLALGNYSLAVGVGAEATGLGSMAVGASNIASGDWSVSLGRESIASGEYSIAMGRESEATVRHGIAIGYATKSNWPYGSTAIGYKCEANDSRTIAVGRDCYANSVGSSAFGYTSTASGNYSTAISGTALGWGSCAIQRGTADGMYGIAIGWESGTTSNEGIAIGYQAASTSTYTIAIGGESNADAVHSMAIGYQANAQIYASTAFGASANAPMQFSTALGYSSDATGGWALAIGANTTASGDYSTCVNGLGNEAHDSYETVLGRYAIIGTGDQSNWVSSDRLLTIGNGSGTSNRSDAMKILKDGRVFFPDVYSDAVGGTNRDLYIDNSGKIGYVSSSKRYKKNIKRMEDVSWLYDLNPVNYTYKTDDKAIKQYGLIAEEVEKINPLFVSYNEKGQVETVQYSHFISPILKALQDQKKINSEQQKEIEELKVLINEMKETMTVKAEK